MLVSRVPSPQRPFFRPADPLASTPFPSFRWSAFRSRKILFRDQLPMLGLPMQGFGRPLQKKFGKAAGAPRVLVAGSDGAVPGSSVKNRVAL